MPFSVLIASDSRRNAILMSDHCISGDWEPWEWALDVVRVITTWRFLFVWVEGILGIEEAQR